jgi:hypothetical protein
LIEYLLEGPATMIAAALRALIGSNSPLACYALPVRLKSW